MKRFAARDLFCWPDDRSVLFAMIPTLAGERREGLCGGSKVRLDSAGNAPVVEEINHNDTIGNMNKVLITSRI